MTTEIEYALMAGASYISTRSDINKFPIPQGWSSVIDPPYFKDDVTGFEAISFTNGTAIVISFAGTGPGFLFPAQPDWVANSALALGALSQQLKDAADYYLKVKAANPGATITLTGHSLGGGLASLIAVMFNESATTFDQAPFRSSALNFTTTDASGNVTTHFAAQDLRNYLAGKAIVNGVLDPQIANLLAPLDAFIAAPVATLATREANVADINVQGEVLSYLPFSRIGTQTDLQQQNNMNIPVDAQIDLHSQALLTAFLQSPSFEAANDEAGTEWRDAA